MVISGYDGELFPHCKKYAYNNYVKITALRYVNAYICSTKNKTGYVR